MAPRSKSVVRGRAGYNLMPHRRGERVLSRFDGSRWVETRMTVISSIRRSRSGKVVTVCHQRSRLTSLDLSAPLRVAVLRSEREREREGGGACERKQSAHEISTRAFPPLTCFVCPTTFPWYTSYLLCVYFVWAVVHTLKESPSPHRRLWLYPLYVKREA